MKSWILLTLALSTASMAGPADTTVLVASTTTNAICSGVNLSGGILFATAAHCVGYRPNIVFAGSDLRQAPHSEKYSIIASKSVPGYVKDNRALDIGFVLLDKPIPGMAETTIKTATFAVGTYLTAYGYSNGVKAAKKILVTGIEGGALVGKCTTCDHGDSGGPVFLQDNLIGVISGGIPGQKIYVSILKKSQLDFAKSQLHQP